MAKLNHFAVLQVLLLVIVLGAEKKLDAAEFRIREIVRTGQAAPGGGTFTLFAKAIASKRGEMFFSANTTSGEGLFVVEQQGTSLLSRSAVRVGYIPSAQTLGYQPVPCPSSDPDSCLSQFYQDSQGAYPEIQCEPLNYWGTTVNLPYVDGIRRPTINDSREILWNGLVRGANQYFPWGCLHTDLMRKFLNRNSLTPGGARTGGMTNSGIMYGWYDVLPGIGGEQTEVDENPFFFIDSGSITFMPGLVGTTIAPNATFGQVQAMKMNNNGQLLLHGPMTGTPSFLGFHDGSSWHAFAANGTLTPTGNTLHAASFDPDSGLNDAGQILFRSSFFRPNGSIGGGIYRRETNGQIKVLAEGPVSTYLSENANSPIINDRGEAILVTGSAFFSGIDYFNSAGNQLTAVAAGASLPGGVSLTKVKSAYITDRGEILFVAELNNGEQGVYVASQASQVALAASIEGNPTETAMLTEGITQTARFPLGSHFSIELFKTESNGSRTPVQSTFSLQGATLVPAITEPTLFPGNVAIQFDRNSINSKKNFLAAHLGNVTLVISPTDSSISPARVNIEINRPQALGTSRNTVTDSKTGQTYNLDEKLIDLGHKRGIPPTFIKGQVAQESNFDIRAFRYELLSSDLYYISTCKIRNSNCNLRTTSPYSLYRLATSDNLSQGSDLATPDDVELRSAFSIRRDGVLRTIRDTDQFVSAQEIYNENPNMGWSRLNADLAQLVDKDPTLLNFSAQTPLASSYGLIQILYSTAINPMGWRGVNGRRNPSLLIDTLANHTAGGGASNLGTGYFVLLFAKSLGSRNSDPVFPNKPFFDLAFTRGFQAYNPFKDRYGIDVMAKSLSYKPIPGTTIFPQ